MPKNKRTGVSLERLGTWPWAEGWKGRPLKGHSGKWNLQFQDALKLNMFLNTGDPKMKRCDVKVKCAIYDHLPFGVKNVILH